MTTIKDWDVNIFFAETYDEETGYYGTDDIVTINPALYEWGDGMSNVTYTDIVIKSTFAEARYIRSQYAEDEFGYDWTDSLQGFLEIAPPRLKDLLSRLPDPNTVQNAESLVG
jgi:hypothetical protein